MEEEPNRGNKVPSVSSNGGRGLDLGRLGPPRRHSTVSEEVLTPPKRGRDDEFTSRLTRVHLL